MQELRLGIRDMPTMPFKEGVVLGKVKKSAEDREFSEQDVKKKRNNRAYERVGVEEVKRLVRGGNRVSTACTVWKGGSDRKGRLVVNLHRQS